MHCLPISLIVLSLCFGVALHAQDEPYGYHHIDAGDSLRKLMQLDEALEQYRLAEEHLLPQESWEGVLRARGHRVRILLQRQQFDDARTLTTTSLDQAIANLGTQHKEVAALYNLLAAIEGLQNSNYPAALKYHQEAYEAVRHLNDDASRMVKARSLGCIGMTLEYLGDYQGAIPYIEQEMAIIRDLEGDSSMFLAFGHQDLGKIQALQGRYREAEKQYLHCLELFHWNLVPHHDFISRSYIDLGGFYQSMGRYSEALLQYEKAEASYAKNHGRQHTGVASAMQLKAEVLAHLGRQAEAEAKFDSGLAILQSILPATHLSIADALHLRSEFRASNSEFKQARTDETEALRIYSELLGAHHFSTIGSLTHLADIELQSGNPEAAIPMLETALARQRMIFDGSGPQTARILHLSAKAHAQSGARMRAIGILDTALLALQASSADFLRYSADPQVVHIYQTKAQIYQELFAQTDSDAYLVHAWEAYQTGVEASGHLLMTQGQDSREFWLEHLFPLYENAIGVAFQLYTTSGDAAYARGALAISEQNKSVLLKLSLQSENALAFARIDTLLLEEESALRAHIAGLEDHIQSLQIAGTEDTLAENKLRRWTDLLFELKREYETLLAKIETESPEYYSLRHAPAVLDTDEIQKGLGADEILIEYFSGIESIYVFALSNTGIGFHRRRFTPEFHAHLTRFFLAIQDAKQHLENPEENLKVFRESSYYLYRILLEPVLRTEKPRILRIIPDGQLCYLPFEVLLTKETEADDYRHMPFVLRDYTVFYDYGMFSQVVDETDASLSYLGMAPAYTDGQVAAAVRSGLGTLVYNQEEVSTGYAMFGGKMFAGDQATVDAFLMHAPAGNILHLAMHGLLDDEQPMLSKLLFSQDTSGSDGLHLYEIFNLNLDADLAILSACHSGAGRYRRGEGVISLARGFRYAGARNIAMSQWAMNDATGKEIVGSFLSEIRNGTPKAQALRSAKLHFLGSSDKLLAHPHYWASLVYIGSNTPLDAVTPVKKQRHLAILGASFLGVSALLLFVYRRRRASRQSD